MSKEDKIDRRIAWTNWLTYFLLSLILVIAAVMLPKVIRVDTAVRDERDLLRTQNEILAEQNTQLATLIEGRDKRLSSALVEVEGLLVDYFAVHDDNVALKLNELYKLLTQNGGHDHDATGDTATVSNAPEATVPRRTTATTAPPPPRTAPTTTAPNQKSCAKRPDHKRC